MDIKSLDWCYHNTTINRFLQSFPLQSLPQTELNTIIAPQKLVGNSTQLEYSVSADTVAADNQCQCRMHQVWNENSCNTLCRSAHTHTHTIPTMYNPSDGIIVVLVLSARPSFAHSARAPARNYLITTSRSCRALCILAPLRSARKLNNKYTAQQTVGTRDKSGRRSESAVLRINDTSALHFALATRAGAPASIRNNRPTQLSI